MLLAQPFLSRVVQPMSAGLLALLGGVLPGNYRDRMHHQLMRAGLGGQFRAEEIITLQVLGRPRRCGWWARSSSSPAPSAAAWAILAVIVLPDRGRPAPEELGRPQGRGADRVDPPGPARHARPPRHLGRGGRGLRRRPRRGVRELHLAAGRRVRAYPSRDGARAPPPGGPPEPEEAHGGAGAIELRAHAHPGRRAGHAGRPGPARPRPTRCATSGGSGPGRRRPSCP